MASSPKDDGNDQAANRQGPWVDGALIETRRVLAESGGPCHASGELIAAGDQIAQVTCSGEHRCLAGLFPGLEALTPARDTRHSAQAERGRLSGIGLVLHTAKGLVEAHGGRIWAESQECERSTFSFSLRVGWPDDWSP